MERPLITEFMCDGFTLKKAHKQYLDNIELWNYVQALDKYCDYLLTECESQKPTSENGKALDLLGVRLSLPNERDICKRANEIKKELEDDKQEFCKASYLMGALDYKNGDIPCNEA